MGKESQTNIKMIRWNGTSNESHRTRMRLSSNISNSTHFTHTISELKLVNLCVHTRQKLTNIDNGVNTYRTDNSDPYLSMFHKKQHDW